MCSMQPKLPVFGSHLKGKMPAYWGPRIRSFAKSPQKGPHQMMAALEQHWTSVVTETRLFGRISRHFQRFR
jgi:hypothetical protein